MMYRRNSYSKGWKRSAGRLALLALSTVVSVCIFTVPAVSSMGRERTSGMYRTAGMDRAGGQPAAFPLDPGTVITQGEMAADMIVAGIRERKKEKSEQPKTIYLTFDDGPSEENTNAVLDVLKARNIKATFFLVGENVRRHPQVARRIAAEGHTIGIHCNRHDYEEIYRSTDCFMEDFQEAYRTVLEVTGAEIKLYRFPGGSINSYNRAVRQEIIDRMSARGFTYFDWNASLEDAVKPASPEELIANAKRTIQGRHRVVLLAHDIVHSTASCLDDLIDQLQDYQMEPLTWDTKPIQFR